MKIGIGITSAGLLIIFGRVGGTQSYISAIINNATSYGGNKAISIGGANIYSENWDSASCSLTFKCSDYTPTDIGTLTAYFIGQL